MLEEIFFGGGRYQKDDILTAADVAKILGVSRQALSNWRAFNRGPAFVRLNASRRNPLIRYRVVDIKAYIDQDKTKGKTMQQNGTLLNINEVADFLSVGISSIYALMRNEEFPKPIKLTGKGTNRWKKDEVVAWLESRRHAG